MNKRVSLTRHAHAQLVRRRQQQQQHRPSAAVVHGGPDGASFASSIGFPLVRPSSSDGATTAAAGAAILASGGPIKYHGGPVVVGAPTVNVYHIYYGSWGANSGKDLIDSFVTALSSESGAQGAQGEASVKGWWAISASYFQSSGGAKKNVSSKVRLAGTVADSYSRGKQLSDDDVLAIVKSKVGPGKPFALDAHGIYVLLTSADVTLSSGFCSQYCGWHTQDFLNSSPLRYAFVGHHGQCPDACGVESTSPNGKPAIDATISTLAHEITEAATDPDVNAGWFDAQGEENADLCSWSYGSTKTGTQQSGQTYRYNLVGLNGCRFLVQLNWDCAQQKCVLQNALPSDGSGGGGPTPSPPPPPPTGGSMKMSCQCTCASASNPMDCQCSCTKTA
ncbi:hypothetical protein CLOM_g10781 [Closterium sp. NIES-68]|nr:hypothetical protein CLOM_g10781 [Closterium sp. NIES-68]GJP79739.1 hypothetical protein CLOP_g9935 [Closterium sp. NIES-67]